MVMEVFSDFFCIDHYITILTVRAADPTICASITT